MKAGIYLVKNDIDENKYIVSLNGKEPFIRISNAISISSFANGKLEKADSIIDTILENPNNFVFTELSKEIENNNTEVSLEKEKITISKDEYDRFTQDIFINPDGNLNKIDVTSDIKAYYHIEWEDAEELFNLVNDHFLTYDKWERIKKKSSLITEANSVIN